MNFTFLFDMGLPMIFPAFFLMLIALLPIILVEAYSLRHSLKINFFKAWKFASIANVLSTLVGIPVTWLLLLMLQLMTGGSSAYNVNPFWQKIFAVTLQAPWMLPDEKNSYWTVKVAMLFLLVPFFFASWFLEYLLLRKYLARELFSKRSDVPESDDSYSLMKKIETQKFYLEIKRAVRNANLFSYGLLALFLLIMTASALLQGK